LKGEEPPVTVMVPLYGAPMVPLGREVVVMVSVFAGTALTVRLSVAFADCGGKPESVILTATDAVPTALCAGVPVIAPVVLLIVSPLGSPVALKA
jgi:hypothetical protein